MAYLAVDKDGTETISDYSLYRNGYYKKYKKCCQRCARGQEYLCFKRGSRGISGSYAA